MPTARCTFKCVMHQTMLWNTCKIAEKSSNNNNYDKMKEICAQTKQTMQMHS